MYSPTRAFYPTVPTNLGANGLVIYPRAASLERSKRNACYIAVVMGLWKETGILP